MRTITTKELKQNALNAWKMKALTAQATATVDRQCVLLHEATGNRCAIGVSLTCEEIEAVHDTSGTVDVLASRRVVGFEDSEHATLLQMRHDGWCATWAGREEAERRFLELLEGAE